ncbi:MAG TPA: stalk domain-containing protein, partial [Bacillota bacterium]
MYINKWLAITALGLLLLARTAVADNSMALSFAGLPAGPEVQAINRDGAVYINLPFLNKYLNIVTAWDISASDLFFKFGKISVKMYAKNRSYYLDGRSQPSLNQAPFEQDGQFWLPLQFLLRMGLAVTSQTGTELSLDWDKNYLLGVESITYQGQPALLLIGSRELEIRDQYLPESN